MLRPGLALYGYAPRFAPQGTQADDAGNDFETGAGVEDSCDFHAHDSARRNRQLQRNVPRGA